MFWESLTKAIVSKKQDSLKIGLSDLMTICLDVLKECEWVGIIMEAVAEEPWGAGTVAWRIRSFWDPPRGWASVVRSITEHPLNLNFRQTMIIF